MIAKIQSTSNFGTRQKLVTRKIPQITDTLEAAKKSALKHDTPHVPAATAAIVDEAGNVPEIGHFLPYKDLAASVAALKKRMP